MGINHLLPILPGGKVFFAGFLKFNFRKELIALDIAGLLHECARDHATAYLGGDYSASLLDFHRTMVYLYFTLKWPLYAVFDGKEVAEKAPEYQRRLERRAGAEHDCDKVRNDPLYLLMAAKICGKMSIPFIIAPEEADSQCKFASIGGKKPTLVITGDSDLLGYGNRRVIVVSSWKHEKFRFFDLTDSSILLCLQDSEFSQESKLLMAGFLQHSTLLLALFAACCGCDFTPHASGLPGIGPSTFFDVIQQFVGDVEVPLSVDSFAEALIASGKLSAEAPATFAEVVRYLSVVSNCYSLTATYYDGNYNKVRVNGDVCERSREEFVKHATGLVNPRTMDNLNPEEQKSFDDLLVHNLGHKSWLSKEDILDYALPPNRRSLNECYLEEIRPMVAARGGNTNTALGESLNKPDLLRVMRGFLQMEENVPSLVKAYDRHKKTSGAFLDNLDMHNATTIHAILERLLEAGELHCWIHGMSYISLIHF